MGKAILTRLMLGGFRDDVRRRMRSEDMGSDPYEAVKLKARLATQECAAGKQISA